MASSNRVVLEARDLSFRYRGDADFGLKHIDVEIRSARCLAFVGFNAQGKSTLCRILGKVAPPRLQARKPDRGRILYFPRSSFACIDPYASTLTSSSLIALSLSALLAFGCLHRYAPNPWSTAVAMLAKPWTVSPFVLAVPVLTAYAIDKLRRMQRDSQYRSRVVYVPRRVELHPQNLAKHLVGDNRKRHGETCASRLMDAKTGNDRPFVLGAHVERARRSRGAPAHLVWLSRFS